MPRSLSVWQKLLDDYYGVEHKWFSDNRDDAHKAPSCPICGESYLYHDPVDCSSEARPEETTCASCGLRSSGKILFCPREHCPAVVT